MSATQHLLRFGVFEINLTTEELRKAGTAVKLPPQPLRLLILLAGRAGQVVSREEIQQTFWGGETDINFERRMNQCIQQVRTALGDDASHPLYLETIHRHGYRFIAPVKEKTIVVAGPRLVEADSSRVPVANWSSEEASAVMAGAVAPDYLAAPNAAVAPAPARDVDDVRQPSSRRRRTRLVWIGVAVLVVVAVIGGGLYWRAHRKPVLTERDTIVLADFDNKTGDPVFDDTLKQGLAIELEQSPFLNVLPDLKVARTLTLMNRPRSERLTEDVAREVCIRTNSEAMLIGSITVLGSQYVIGLKVVDCNTGDVLAEAQKQAAGKEAVLKALDAAATSLRGKLGESLGSVKKYATPLEEATTPSLEALQAYSLGEKERHARGSAPALAFFQRAVELDPSFAMAFAGMSASYKMLHEPVRSAENARRAYDLRQKVSQREHFYIESLYFMTATGELERATQVYELWREIYPRDSTPYKRLTYIYGLLGDWEKALEEARVAIRLEPNDAIDYNNLGNAYVSLNRLDEAGAVYKQAEERRLSFEYLLGNSYVLAFLKGDPAEMSRLVASAKGKAGTEDLLLADQALTEYWYGKLRAGRELTWRAMDLAARTDSVESAAIYQAWTGLLEADVGQLEEARANASAALKLAPNRDTQAAAALALARAGDMARAGTLANELEKNFPLDTLVQRYRLPSIRAAIALQNKKPEQAVELLKAASAIELGDDNTAMLPVYLRGQAYLILRDGNAAAAEFQKFVDHRGVVANATWGALARLGLARAYALDAANDPAARNKARTAYQNFLTLWKDADPDIPIYQQAKAEYARLQ